MNGIVVYSSGGNYKVLTDKKVYLCKPLGIFRKNKIKILVGDNVEIEVNENKKGLSEINVITKLFERRNEFIRPNISNIDYAMIVTSILEPKLNDYYLDKLITIFQSKSIEPILIFTKKDLRTTNEYEQIINEYINEGYRVLITDKEISFEQINKLKLWTKNKFGVITGQTGVGKSTFINLLNSDLNLNTNEISKALGRGKHTTRHAEAFEIFNNSFIIDTPGFSSLDVNNLTKEDISINFFTFKKHISSCKFKNCIHIKEEICGVKKYNYSSRIMNNYYKLLKEI